jgi:hypothetical protein
MGLFEKKIKKPADIDDAPQPEPAAPPPAPAKPAAPPEVKAAAKPGEAQDPNFGINKAIELMRMLPADNIELVVRVVKTTLESTNIKVSTIITDATRKQAGLEARVHVLTKEIAALETEIATRRAEIATLEADHKETSTVKERLLLAEKLSASGGVELSPSPPVVAPALAPRRAVTPSTSPTATPATREEPPR